MLSDDELLRQFDDRTLPAVHWTHRTHVRTTYAVLRSASFDDAVEHMRRGIRAYNDAIGVENGPDAGYHETVTVAWVRIVHALMGAHGRETSSDAFLERHPYLLDKYLLLLFYTRDRINDREARARFVAPDVTALPE